MGSLLSDSLFVQENCAGLQNRKVEELVSAHVFRRYGLDIVLLVFHGLDDNDHR